MTDSRTTAASDAEFIALTKRLAGELSLKAAQVEAVAGLLDDGATVPFISRYRKEATGDLDEVGVTAVRDGLARLRELEKRRAAVRVSLEERDLLNPELAAAVDAAASLTALEDIYLPYRPKRRTRAAVARERGLGPLASAIRGNRDFDAARFVNPGKDIPDEDAALAGARDIIAEELSEDMRLRGPLRELFVRRGRLAAKKARGRDPEDDAVARFRDWFDWEEPAVKAAGHRILALFRGESEGALSLRVRPADDEALSLVERRTLGRHTGPALTQMKLAVTDSWKRLLAPSLETEFRQALKQRADREAIRVFASNLRELLLAAPLGRRRVMALDPGYRTGAKLTVLDEQGSLLHHTTVYPTRSENERVKAGQVVTDLCGRYSVQAVAVGNGTAGRETETFLRGLDLPGAPEIVLVDESGASIYSASEIAREEFPDLDLTVRGSVSIGRRLMDPLAELVKIDPKSIGVGQYQHDVDQSALKQALDDTVMHCVNSVGVELNTASAALLQYVSGLGPTLAANIVAHRDANGPFRSRRELLKVKRLGPKAFEQCAGFLRVRDGENPLDASAVHPERYELVGRMAADAGCAVTDLLKDPAARGRVDLNRYVAGDVGMPTLRDIMSELERPGRDPREAFAAFQFADVHSLDDLRPGMVLPGIVTNVTKFGAFVDVGVKRDGLVHISELADRFVSDPADVVKVRQQVTVRVLEVDGKRGRASFSMKGM